MKKSIFFLVSILYLSTSIDTICLNIDTHDNIKNHSVSTMANIQSIDGDTALHWTVYGNYDENHKLKVLAALFEDLPNPFITNNKNNTPQQEARLSGQYKVADLLEEWEKAYYSDFSDKKNE